MTTQLSTHRDLLTLTGTVLGTSGWAEITQSQVDQFAEATFGIRYELEGRERPPCVAETIYLYR
jgi:hypothetical protein